MNHEAEHESVQLLLPWYVNGSLEEAEHRRVALHIAACRRCAAVHADEIRLAATLRQARESAPDAEAAYRRLAARLDTRPGLHERFARFLREIPGPARAMLAGQLVVIALLAGLLLMPVAGRDAPPPVYRTVSTPAQSVGAQGTLVSIHFRAEASQHAVNALLLQHRAQIVAGPNRAGAYVIRLPEDSGPARAALAASPLVDFTGSVPQ